MAPFRFTPLLKTPLWGGRDIVALKGITEHPTVGESWEISGLAGEETIVREGRDMGKSLAELIEQYGAALMGQENLRRYGKDFPLLIKFISAADPLSIQVHPDDKMAQQLANVPYGKSEMWYVVDAHEGASIYSGFKKDLTLEDFDKAMAESRLPEQLVRHNTHAGDSFFIPAGQIHSIGCGNFIIEIQQSCNLVYRVCDFDRTDAHGKKRELHLDLARKALHFKASPDYQSHYRLRENERILLEQHTEFTTNLYHLTQPLRADHGTLDSFVVFIAFAGAARLTDACGNDLVLRAGESVLFPAENPFVDFQPMGETRFSCIETYVDPDNIILKS